jgi:Tol biopolymer transport system component
MTVTAPPRPPSSPQPATPDDLEALIEEARRRARRRRLRNTAAAVAVGAILLGAIGAGHLGRHGSTAQIPTRAPRPTPIPARPLPANGDIALVQRNTLVAKAPDGSRTRLLATCPGSRDGECDFGNFAWSPNGGFLVFLAGHFGGAVSPNNVALYVVGADGLGPRKLARCGNCNQWQRLSWSPDSRSVAFVADIGVYVVDVASGTVRRLDVPALLAAGPGAGSTVAWSPGGSRIALTDGGDLYTVNPGGSGLARIATVGPDVSDVTWSPDGTKIAFDTGDNVYVVDAEGSHLRLLLGGALGSGPGVPAWSPDGHRILYFYTPGSPGRFRGEVWSMRADGSDRRRLYHAPCCVGEWRPPIWSPDGRWIAFAGASETSGVVVMDAGGMHRRRLLDLSSVVAWQPRPRR